MNVRPLSWILDNVSYHWNPWNNSRPRCEETHSTVISWVRWSSISTIDPNLPKWGLHLTSFGYSEGTLFECKFMELLRPASKLFDVECSCGFPRSRRNRKWVNLNSWHFWNSHECVLAYKISQIFTTKPAANRRLYCWNSILTICGYVFTEIIRAGLQWVL